VGLITLQVLAKAELSFGDTRSRVPLPSVVYSIIGVSPPAALTGYPSVIDQAAGPQDQGPVPPDSYDPVTLAQGRIVLSFNRMLQANEFAFNSDSLAAIKSPLTSQLMIGIFTIREVLPHVPPPVTEPGKPGEKRWTQVDITFDNSPRSVPGNLERLSASRFTEQCDYLVYYGLRVPEDVTITGTLSLQLNGTRRIDAYIPFHQFASGDQTAIFVPLNEAARSAMDDYRMFNPSNGFLPTNLP
jgi:hypothetical protein